MAEKQQQFASFSQKLKEDQERQAEREREQTTKLSKALAEKEGVIQSLEKQVQEEKNARAMEASKLKSAAAFQSPPIPTLSPDAANLLLNQSPQQPNGKSLFGTIWKYLTRTVIVVNLKPVPKIQKDQQSGGR